MRQPAKWAAVVAAAAVLVGGGLWLAWPGDAGSATSEQPAASAALAPSLAAEPATSLSRGPGCDAVSRPFAPRAITIPGVARAAAVVAPPRDANGVPGTPPLTAEGKAVFAWDREQGIRPGDAAGNVLLNAHTWPDGSALGNRLLAALHRGDRIVVRGAGARLCYRVTERVEVLAVRGLPRYYTSDGPPQLAIVVCSGRRLGPGVWEKRTVWFAAPAT
jgi:hypothetical protein